MPTASPLPRSSAPAPGNLQVVVGHHPGLQTPVAQAMPGAARWLRQAGFVRDATLGLYRPRRGTPAHTAEYQLQDACHLLAYHGFGVTRVYSEAEQRDRLDEPDLGPQGVALTTGSGSADNASLVRDIQDGHLVMLAHHQSRDTVEFLGRYTASGAGVVGRSPDFGYFGLTSFPELDAAGSAWAARGYATQLPSTEPRRAAAAASSSARAQPLAAAAEAVPPAFTRSAPPKRAR